MFMLRMSKAICIRIISQPDVTPKRLLGGLSIYTKDPRLRGPTSKYKIIYPTILYTKHVTNIEFGIKAQMGQNATNYVSLLVMCPAAHTHSIQKCKYFVASFFATRSGYSRAYITSYPGG